MTLTIGTPPPALSPELAEKLSRVSFPTIGHYLEEGFVEPAIQRQCGTKKVVGRAITVRLTGQDSTVLHHAAGYCEPGDVFVIDMGGDTRHAPVGEVLGEILHARGATGVIIDGVMTDIDEVEPLGLPVYSRGRSVLTTKLLHLDAGGLHVPVSIGGVSVHPGDVVLADRNGVFIAAPAVLEGIVDTALADDAEEPELVEQVRNGERLGDLTGATTAIQKILAEREATR